MAKKYERKTKKPTTPKAENTPVQQTDTNVAQPLKVGAEKGEFGQKPHVPTDENRKLVKALTAYGIPMEKVAIQLEISHDTLGRHYRRELDIGKVEAVAKMGEGVYQRGIKGSVADAHFYLKTQGAKYGWSEKHQHEHTGANGGPKCKGFRYSLYRPFYAVCENAECDEK